MQQFVDRTTDDKQIKYDNHNLSSNIICYGFPWWGERRELVGCGVVENPCVGRHVDIDPSFYPVNEF